MWALTPGKLPLPTLPVPPTRRQTPVVKPQTHPPHWNLVQPPNRQSIMRPKERFLLKYYNESWINRLKFVYSERTLIRARSVISDCNQSSFTLCNKYSDQIIAVLCKLVPRYMYYFIWRLISVQSKRLVLVLTLSWRVDKVLS